jgi:hypothetical protein
MKKETETKTKDDAQRDDLRKVAPCGVAVRSGVRAGALSFYAALTANGTALSGG